VLFNLKEARVQHKEEVFYSPNIILRRKKKRL
jgi:hypothetical protein